MVIKKLGRELDAEFLDVVSYLVEGERMRVVVEPHMYEAAAAAGLPLAHLYTFAPGEAGRCGAFKAGGGGGAAAAAAGGGGGGGGVPM
jgi:hypothetical protein